MTNSRQKGKRIELEAAALLRSLGFPSARRGQQFSGSPDSPDVVAIPGLHIEVKGVERLNIWDAMEQACRDSKGGDNIPVVLFRRNRSGWLVCFHAEQCFAVAEHVRVALEKADTGELETKEET